MRSNALLSRLKTLLTSKRFNHTFAEAGAQERSSAELSIKSKRRNAQSFPDVASDSDFGLGHIDTSQWKKLDSRTLGIRVSMISEPSWIVLKVLQSKGFEAYLVGGCVRDLILNRTPKDFDVITSAALAQVQKQFNHSEIVGQRFPICIIPIKGSVIEVSSFQTVAQHTVERETFLDSQMSRSCDKIDLVLWRDCMRRDFTINSLFFNPFANKIYDYANGLVDLRSLKLRTLKPAHLSFTEDSARILRGVRVAARLGLSLSKETESAMRELSLSVMKISKSRIMMELNYMLSYGAAEPSLYLLQRIGLLEILLPFHAAYLTRHAIKSGQSAMMLMKLFFNLDRLVSCDRPSASDLWVGLLAFHLALVEKPQHPLVIWTLASLLYYGKWKDAVHFARQHAQTTIRYEPEILEANDLISDDELAERVTQLQLLIQDSANVLTKTASLHERMASFPGFPCSGLVFISNITKSNIVCIFKGTADFIKSNTKGRTSFEINYNLLRKRNVQETRFVIGKIIMDTMSWDVKTQTMSSSNSELQPKMAKQQQLIVKHSNLSEHKITKKHLANVKEQSEKIAQRQRGLVKKKEYQKAAKNHHKMISKENVAISQDYIAKNEEKLAVCRSPSTNNKDMLKREKREQKQVWKSKKQKVEIKENKGMKVVEIKENKGMAVHLDEIEKVRCLASQNEEKLTVCRSPSTNNKDMSKREKREQQQVSKSKKQKVVEIKESKGMAVHLDEIEKVRCLASQKEVTKEQKPVENCHLHPSNVSGEQIGKHKLNMTKGKGGQLPLSDLFK